MKSGYFMKSMSQFTYSLSLRYSKILKAILFAFSLIAAPAILVISLNIRPAADDFCFAKAINMGFLPSIWNWYLTWVGDLSVTTLNTLLVGLPISVSPKLSLIPFLSGALSVALLGSRVLFRKCATGTRLLSIILILILWITYLWFPAFSEQKLFGPGGSNQIAEQTTFWQVTNSSYVIPTSLVLLLFLFLRKQVENQRKHHQKIIFPVGLFIGMIGYVIATSTIICLASILFIIYKSRETILGKKIRLSIIVLSLGVGTGMAISLLSPGAAIRKSNFQHIGTLEILSHIPKIVILSLSTILEILGSASFVIAIISGFVIYSLKRDRDEADNNLILPLSFILIVVTLVNRISEIFSYSATSHLEVSYLVAFVLGLEIGKRLNNTISDKKCYLMISALSMGLFIVFSTVGILYFSHEVNAFLEAWNSEQGFKFIPSYSTGWIAECAHNLWSS
jgi:hypothetical protein